MHFWGKKEETGDRVIAIFDIASASVGGAFVRLRSGDLPQVIFTTREDIPFQEKIQFNRFLESMRRTLESVFTKMQASSSGVKVSDAFCVLSSPWYASQTRIIQYDRKESFLVTEKGVAKLLEKELDLFRQSKLYTQSHNGKFAPVIIESKNIQMKLNGYPLEAPFGKEANQLEIALYVSIAPGNIYNVIQNAISSYWQTSNIHFSSFSFTAFDILRDMFSSEESFLFMDISGEVTDLTLAKDGVLLESISFPAGKHMLVRGLINHLGVTPAVAIDELKLYLEGKSTHEHAALIEDGIQESTSEWVLFFRDALAQIGQEFPIPRRIFYTADEEVSSLFETAIIDDFAKREQTFAIKSLNNDYLKNFVSTIDPQFIDPFIEIETVFADKIIKLNKKS